MQAEAMTAPQGPEPTTVPSGAEARLQRNLKLVVIGLAVLLFAGLATIVGRVIYLASGASTQPAAPSLAIRPEQSIGTSGRGAGAVRLALGGQVSGTLRSGRNRGHCGSRSADRADDHDCRPQAHTSKLARGCWVAGRGQRNGLIDAPRLPYRFAAALSRSSSGLGHQPLTLGTGVRVPYGAPPSKIDQSNQSLR